MQITKNKIGTIHYTLTDDSGSIIDSSRNGTALSYLHGNHNLITGMENALEGKKTGEKFKVNISPEEGYGPKDERLINKVPLNNFPEKNDIKVGAQFQADTNEGPRVATVILVDNESATVDFNHPLAGKTLHFDIEVVDVRAATADELTHGHAHGAGGHHH